MIIPYNEYELLVFNGLQEYRKLHPSFAFSVRQNGSKGSELDYFIGTSKSRYFGFTCWLIPISFPGSSSDLIDFFFYYAKDGRIGFYMEASAPKRFAEPQLLAAVAFVHHLRQQAEESGELVTENPESKKFIDYILSPEIRVFGSFDELWNAFIPFMEKAIKLVDKAISLTKADYPEWQAEPISDEKFKGYLDKMENRFQRYSHINNAITIAESNVTEIVKEIKDFQIKDHSLNQILYGPPGTGKTYHTINKSLKIIDPAFYENHKHDRKKLLQRFNALLIKDWSAPKGQIAFTTFHQSMSYEDFIEGIKPVVDEETLNDGKANIRYEIKDGLFKLMSQKASWKKGNFEAVVDSLKNECSEQSGNPAIQIKGMYTSFDLIYKGTTVFYVSPHNSIREKPWYPVNIDNIRKAHETGVYKGIYNPTYVREILNYLYENKGLVKSNHVTEDATPHVLIIDEINRGNVSQIFGELITLVETSKRAGREEQIEAMLAYSKQPFSVPENLYIIGTMNTADRSVEALDTALRRRFTFEEMMPDPALLSPAALLATFLEKHDAIGWEEWISHYSQQARDFYDFVGLPAFEIGSDEERALCDLVAENTYDTEKATAYLAKYDLDPDIDIEEILTIINERITVLYDREHGIGHSFFFKIISKDHPLTALRQIFKDEIIPLLQEYFFSDYTKIGLILGQDFILTKGSGKIKPGFFADFKGVSTDDYSRPVYDINPDVFLDNETFKQALLKMIRKDNKLVPYV